MEDRRVMAASFDIVIEPGPTLANHFEALEAFERAAEQWESHFTDPITVTVQADLAPLPPGVLGAASSIQLIAPFDVVRERLVSDAADEVDDRIVASLPTLQDASFLVPSGIGVIPAIVSNKAALKAMEVPNLDDAFGAVDAKIVFSTDFPFDYDDRDGVDPDKISFETVAAHEIGHALGFTSIVDFVDVLVANGVEGNVPPMALDLFRFADDTPFDPNNPKEFASFPRSLLPGVPAVTDQTHAMAGSKAETAMSTGRFTGDGRQASHFKEDALTGETIGIMDPTLGRGRSVPISRDDLRALDLIGYDYHVGKGKSGPGSKGPPHEQASKGNIPESASVMLASSAGTLEGFQLVSDFLADLYSVQAHPTDVVNADVINATGPNEEHDAASDRADDAEWVIQDHPAKLSGFSRVVQTGSLAPTRIDIYFEGAESESNRIEEVDSEDVEQTLSLIV